MGAVITTHWSPQSYFGRQRTSCFQQRDHQRVVRSPTQLYFASVIGLIMTAVVVAITNYYTSMRYRPVQKIAHASRPAMPPTSLPD